MYTKGTTSVPVHSFRTVSYTHLIKADYEKTLNIYGLFLLLSNYAKSPVLLDKSQLLHFILIEFKQYYNLPRKGKK